MLTEVDAHQLASDAAAAQVWKGAEDGRLLRILVCLTSILERPNSEGNPQWAETGHDAACSHSQEHVRAPRCSDGIPFVSGKAETCMKAGAWLTHLGSTYWLGLMRVFSPF